MKAYPIYHLTDNAVPSHVKAAARRSDKPYKHVKHVPGGWQLLTDADLDAIRENTRRILRREGEAFK